MTSTPLSRAMSALYMWKIRNPRRRVTIELNSIALEGVEPAVKVTLLGSGLASEGSGSTLPEAVKDALSKDDDGSEHGQAG